MVTKYQTDLNSLEVGPCKIYSSLFSRYVWVRTFCTNKAWLTCKSFLFHTVPMVPKIALLTANPIYFRFGFITTSAYYIIFPLIYPTDIRINCYSRTLSPTISCSFAISLVPKILPAITFFKPIFFFGIFLPLFILSSSEWPQFSFNYLINFSFK